MVNFVRVAAMATLAIVVVVTWMDRPVEAVDDQPDLSEPQGVRVLELFTSEGCSSCPPADRLLAELAERDDVIALSFHVDYWDRLGWKDPFSLKEATGRQYRYADLFSSNQVYTPQVVIGGQREAVGSRRADVLSTLARVSPVTNSLDVSVVKRAASREVVIRTAASHVNVALVQPRATTNVERGENGGRTLSHVNVVRDFATITPENGVAKATLLVPSDSNGAFVVAYSQSPQGAIYAVKVVR